jgi:hypothetical protein
MLKHVTTLDIIILSTNTNGPWMDYSYYYMMVQRNKGLHSFVSKWQAIIGDSLCENYNSIIHPSSVRKLKQVTILDIIILSTNMNVCWKAYSYFYMMMVKWRKGLHSFLKYWAAKFLFTGRDMPRPKWAIALLI